MLRKATVIHYPDTASVPVDVAQEMAQVGIIPSGDLDPIGQRTTIAGQVFVVTGHATREEFLDALVAAGLGYTREDFAGCPAPYYLKVSTD